MISPLYFTVFFAKNNKKLKNNESKKITGTKISENERLAMLIVSKALGFAFNIGFRERREEIFNHVLLLRNNTLHPKFGKDETNCCICFSTVKKVEKTGMIMKDKNSPICTNCFINNACSLAKTEIRNNLEESISINNRESRKDKESRSSDSFVKKVKGDSDICSALGINSLSKLNTRDEFNKLIRNQGQPVSSITMQFIISDIKSWSKRKDLYIARADCSNLLHNNNCSEWKDWKEKLNIKEKDRIPDGWFLFPICCGNIKEAIWHLIIINRWKRSVKGWVFEFTNKKALDTSLAKDQLGKLFKKKADIKWNLVKRNQISGPNSGVLVAVKMAVCIWTYINAGDVFNLMNKFALKVFNADPDLNISAARKFLSKTGGKLSEVTQYLEKVSECPAIKK